MAGPLTIGVLPLGRATFDVPFAEEMAAKAFATLDGLGHRIVGPRALLFDADQARAAAEQLKGADLDALILLQVTFTDASMTIEIARGLAAGLLRAPVVWAVPEPRAGGRLRLNAFCGLNLAVHALGRADLPYRALFVAPDSAMAGAELLAALDPRPRATTIRRQAQPVSAADEARADRAMAALRGRRLGVVGAHPAGFDTCRYDPAALNALTGIEVATVDLRSLFARAAAIPPDRLGDERQGVAALVGLDALDQPQLSKSLSLHAALDDLRADEDLSAMAVRCWPETFTEYGCAICGPMGMLNRDGVPAACEADVYGAATQLMLNAVAGAEDGPSWLVDIVDMDQVDGTAVFWHCGSAPEQMRDPQSPAEAQIHSNRRMPLLYQFALKPGRITIARLTQARNRPRLVVTGGEVIRRPISFTGTSAVVRFDAPIRDVMDDLIDEGLEHHVAMIYGDYRGAMAALGARLGVPVQGLGH